METYEIQSSLKENSKTYKQIQKKVQSYKQTPDLPPQIKVSHKNRVAETLASFSLNEEVYNNIRCNCDNTEIIDIDFKNTIRNELPKKTVIEAENEYTDKKVTAQILRGLTDWLCESYIFRYIDGHALYIYCDGEFIHFTYNYAARFLTQVFRHNGINYPLKSPDYKEIVRLLQSQPQILVKQEDCKTNTAKILFADGVFEAMGNGRICKPSWRDYQFSKICFPLEWDREYGPDPEAREFIKRFCNYDETREDYFWELIGYLLSSYQQKIIVVFLGPSNSGKSTLANMVRRICGTDACVAMGIKELSGNFNIAELHGKRLCVDSEMDATTLNAKDISLLKKVVGNDLMQGNRKHEQQFYFQCQTKFLLCTNNKIKFRSDEDSVSLLNRIKVFELQSSIPQEEQNYDMDSILDYNRTYLLQQAMKGLLRLVSNSFQFSCNVSPVNFVENVTHQIDLKSVDNFVAVCCHFGEEDEETVTDLYKAYKEFAIDNDFTAVSSKAFSCHIVNIYGVFRKRTNRNRYFQGIRLVTSDE